jgi:hypothetical protein
MMQSETRQPGENIPIPRLLNLRDLGGWPTRDGGRVRWGQVDRSTDLSKFEWSRGRLVKVVYDVADDAYVDVERHLAAALKRD